ncbi:MAG: hypothetical protein ACK5TW_00245 [Cyanobacteriota bacterium]|jgi:hypothetical protein
MVPSMTMKGYVPIRMIMIIIIRIIMGTLGIVLVGPVPFPLPFMQCTT